MAASQSALVISENPWPLQEFWPLQALCALLHAEVPLQELTPSQCILASSALATETAAVLNRRAAAVAIAAPVTVIFMD